jgi:glycosyltransferase involved in cell wall biosynthesis
MSQTPLRVLLSAYQCAPGMGSVSQIGWEWYSRLSRQCAVTLVTHVRNRSSLTAAGAPLPGSEVIYIDTEWFAGPLYRMASKLFPGSQHTVFLLSSLDFFLYDRVALKQLRKRAAEWDLVHAVTPVSPIAATRLYRLGIPMILGPWNGGLPSPDGFPEIMRKDRAWMYRIRVLGRLLDRLLGCTRHAALILSATQSTDRSLPAGVRSVRMLENGVDLERFHPTSEAAPPAATIRALFVGRLQPFKGVAMLLEAIAQVTPEIPIVLTIVGDGPTFAELRKDVAARGLDQSVIFAGETALERVAGYMRQADVLCLPSIRESGGAVLLEALASGIPVIAADHGGPAELVDDEVGRKISAEGPQQLVRDLVAAFRDMASHREAWRERGRRGRIRAEKRYGWDTKIAGALSLYGQVLHREPQGLGTFQEGGTIHV